MAIIYFFGVTTVLGVVGGIIGITIVFLLETIAAKQLKCPSCNYKVVAGGDANEELLSRCPKCYCEWR